MGAGQEGTRLSKPLVASLLAALLLTIASAGRAAGERAVLTFDVPPVPIEVGVAKPTCGDAVDVTKILADPSLYAALIGVDPVATIELASTAALLRRLERNGRDTKSLVVHREGNVHAQCQTGCAVLPKGVHVREVLLSDRHAGDGASISGFDRRVGPVAGEEAPGSGSDADVVTMGDSGYRGLRVARGERAVCVTAMNWNATHGSTQVVKIFFDR